MAPVLDLELDVSPAESLEELFEGLAPDDVEDEEAVAEGMADKDVGESALKQLASSVIPTSFTSELPPFRPRESVIIHTMEVPPATSAIHSYEVGPLGGERMKASPPGIAPVMVTGCTAVL